jgi:ATP-dependent Lhr-like helicase
LSGEQFALPEAIALLREVRRRATTQEWICVAATDPSNLLGSVLPGARIPRVPGSRVLYRDGIPIGTLAAGRMEWLVTLKTVEESIAKDFLMHGPGWSRPDVLRGHDEVIGGS